MNSKSLSKIYVPIILIVMGILIVIPIGSLLYGSFWSSRPGAPGQFTTDNYIETFTNVRSISLLTTSLFYAFGAALLATSVATVIAFITARTDTPLAGIFTYIPFASLAIPGIVNSISWIYLLRPNTGLINLFFMDTLGFQSPLFDIHTIWGMIWVMGLSLTPLAYVGVRAAIVSLDPSLEEAGRIAGRGIRPVLIRITLPLILPAMLSVFLLAFIISFESFDIPAVIGIPGNIDVYMSVIATSVIYDVPPDHGLATSQSVVMLIVTMLLVVLYRKATRRAEKFAVISGRGYAPGIMKIGKWRWLGLVFLLTYLFIDIILPISTLLISSLLAYWHPRTLFEDMSFQNYLNLLRYPGLVRSLFNSIFVSSIAAFVALFMGILIAFYSLKSRIRGRGILEGIGMLPISFPGLVLGVGFLWAFISFPFGIYGTIWVILLAYIIKYIPHGIRFVSEPLLQVHRDLEDASRISGASTLYTLRKITISLLKPALIGGWVYIAMITFRELGAAVLLVSPGNEVISERIYAMWRGGHFETAVAASMILVAAIWIIIVIARIWSKKKLSFKPTP